MHGVKEVLSTRHTFRVRTKNLINMRLLYFAIFTVLIKKINVILISFISHKPVRPVAFHLTSSFCGHSYLTFLYTNILTYVCISIQYAKLNSVYRTRSEAELSLDRPGFFKFLIHIY